MAKKKEQAAVPQEAPTEAPAEESQTAAQEQQTQTKGTSERLFPEYYEQPPVTDQEMRPKIPQEPRIKETEPILEEKTEPSPPDEVLGLDDLKGRKFKLKVDGQEIIVPAEMAFKNFQLEQHWTRKNQSVSEQNKVVAEKEKLLSQKEQELKSILDNARNRAPEANTIPEEYKDTVTAFSPIIQNLVDQIGTLKNEIVQQKAVVHSLSTETRPVRYRAAIEDLDQRLTAEGYEDFKTYLPKVEQAILQKGDGLDEAEWNRLWNNPMGFEIVYKDLKSKDLLKEMTKNKATGATPKPKFVKVEGGASTPTQTEDTGNQRLIQNAKKTGNWNDVIRKLSDEVWNE